MFVIPYRMPPKWKTAKAHGVSRRAGRPSAPACAVNGAADGTPQLSAVTTQGVVFNSGAFWEQRRYGFEVHLPWNYYFMGLYIALP